MAQELDKVINLLREMKNTNDSYAESFDRLLGNMSTKLDVLKNTDSSALIKAYMEELSKSVEEKYSATSSRFRDIENALKTIYNDQSNIVKSSDMKELFDIFVKNMSGFYEEEKQEKIILSNVEAKLNTLSGSMSDKEDIERVVDMLRSDFENLNHAYKNTINDIHSNLQSILNGFAKVDQAMMVNVSAKEQIAILSTSVTEIIDKLQIADKKATTMEKLLSNVVTNETLKITQGAIESIIEKADDISNKILTLADKSDISEMKNLADFLNSGIEQSATKHDVADLDVKTEELINQADNLKVTLGELTKNFENIPDIKLFENSLKDLNTKLDNISNDLTDASIKKDMTDTVLNISSLKSELSTVKNIVTDLNDVIASKVLSSIENISFATESFDLKSHISKMLAELPQKNDIEKILAHNEFDNKAIENLIEKTDILADRLDKLPTHKDMDSLNSNQLSLVENLQAVATKDDVDSILNKAAEIEQQIADVNFDKEFESIFDKTTSIETMLSNSNLDKVSPDSKVHETISEKLINIEEFLNNRIVVDTKDLKDAVEDLKELVSAKQDNLKQNAITSQENAQSIEEYLADIKNILDTVENKSNNEFIEKFESIENLLKEYKDSNEKSLSKLMNNGNISDTDNNIEECEQSLKESLKEIIDLKEKIQDLSESFGNVNSESAAMSSEFLKSKFEEFSNDIEKMKSDIESGFEHGFSYSAELLEEKMTMLLDVVKELRHDSTDNIELFERLTVADNKLMDFREEFRLLSTDVVNTFNAKTELFVQEFQSIKQQIEDLKLEAVDNSKVEKEIKNLHNSVDESLQEETKYSKSTYDSLEEVYDRITQRFDDVENNLKDFILGDVDSLIIKIDEIKESLETSSGKTNIPSVHKMAEYNSFVKDIEKFKNEQQELLKSSFEKVENVLTKQQEEIKSILSVASNNEEIIEAIEDLKKCFKSHLSNQTSAAEEQIPEIHETQIIDYELTDELKKKFKEISKSIESLSGENAQITTILQQIAQKMENEESDDSEQKTEEDNFDFIKAFDLLQKDISDIGKYIRKAIPSKDIVETTKKLTSPDTKILDSMSENINKILDTVNKDWLSEIKDYLSGDNEVNNLLKDINSKIDVLMLTDNTGWVDDIKNTISSIDSSKGAVSSKTQELLDIINSKIDILADADNYESVEEISSMLQLIDNKIDVISESGNNSDDYFEELTSMVQAIDGKIDVISENGNNSDGHLEDLTSMVQAIDNKIDTLSQNDDSFENVEQLNEITTMLETLNHKLDVIADSESYLETESSFEEIRNLILEQQDYIKQLEPSEKLDTFKTCLDDIAKQLDSFIASSTQNDDTDSVTPEVIQNNLKEMKNSIMSAVVDIFNQVSFVEESEDIKDFVEEKTNKINENLESVTQQLKQLASSDNSSEYTYSMQDIETDLTKMRMALNEISRSNTFESSAAPYLNTITDSLNRITYSVDSLTQDEIQNLKTDINGLKTETQNLLATSNESYNALNSDLTNKVSIVASLVKKSNETTDVMRKALIYIGEWIDSASESMNKISSNSEDISVIKSAIETFGQAIPNQAKILSEIEENIESQHEKLQHFDKSISKIENLEEIFARQEERIDRLEANIDKVLSAIEDIDDESITRKIDKIDKQIAKLSTNIEKLASYVDE